MSAVLVDDDIPELDEPVSISSRRRAAAAVNALEAAQAGVVAGRGPWAWETLADFAGRAAAMPEPTWLIRDLVMSEGRYLLVAEPNAGKTWLLFVVGRDAAAQGRRVFLVLEEGGPKPTAARLAMLGVPPDAPIFVAHLRGVTLAADIAALEAAAREHEAPVFIFDPWVSVSGGAEENDATEQKAQLELCNRLMRANSRALLLIAHHANKSGAAGDGSRMMSSRGSSAFPGWADGMLYLEHVPVEPGSGLVSFDVEVVKMRDGERGAVIRVCIDLGDGLTTYTPRAQARAEEKAAQQNGAAEDLERGVLEALAAGPASGAELARDLKKNKARVLSTLKILAARDQIARDGNKWRSVPEPVPAVPEPRIDRFHGSRTLEGAEPEPIPGEQIEGWDE